MLRTPFNPDPAKPFQLVKFLSWSSFILILFSSISLAIIIGNYARQFIIEQEQEFAHLLAENLNHQIYQRFTLPTVLGFGRIRLKEKEQYERLDQVINYTIQGLQIIQVQIYDPKGRVSYASQGTPVNQEDLASNTVQQALKGEINFKIIKENSYQFPWLRFELPEKSYLLQTTFPIRIEKSVSQKYQGSIIGILRFTQDISSEYESLIYFQWMIALIALLVSLLLFLFLYIIIRKADRLLDERIKEKERLERQLHQNEKLASMGRMVASISHEIKNPLGVIQSSAELLSKRKTEDQASTKLSQAIFEESKRLSNTVNDFLDYARPQEPKNLDVNISNLVNQAVRFLDSELQKKQISLDNNLPENQNIKGDPDLLYRVIYNLLTNACQAVDNNGQIEIKWLDKEKELIISDSGPGFDPEMIDKYLEPFFTTKDTGTGLGLAIVSNILARHGYSLRLNNGEKGAQVIINFQGVENHRQ